jgi:aminoglycoside phosphotransferase (APT) family kinase protein
MSARDDPPSEVLRRYGRACPGVADLPRHRPDHAAIARVWMLGDGLVLRARTGGPGVTAAFGRERRLLQRAGPLLPWGLPATLAADDGRFHVRHGGALWTLHRALPGRILRPWQDLHRAPDDERERLLVTLRELHRRTSGRLGPGHGGWLVADVAPRLDAVSGRLSEGACRRARAALERLARRPSGLPGAFVHGDFHGGNLLVDDQGGVTGLVDLDWCRVGDPVEDLAYTAMMLVRDGEGRAPRLEDLPRLLGWYGLPGPAEGAFADAFVLYAVFDVHLFLGARGLPDRERWAEWQTGLVEEASRVL